MDFENKVYIIVSWDNDYGALNYEDKYSSLSLEKLKEVYNEEEDDFTYKVLDIEPTKETHKLLEVIHGEELIDYDHSKHSDIFLIDKIW